MSESTKNEYLSIPSIYIQVGTRVQWEPEFEIENCLRQCYRYSEFEVLGFFVVVFDHRFDARKITLRNDERKIVEQDT